MTGAAAVQPFLNQTLTDQGVGSPFAVVQFDFWIYYKSW